MRKLNRLIRKLFPTVNPFGISRSYYNPGRSQTNLPWEKIKYWALKSLLVLAIFILVLFAWYAKDLPTPGKIKFRQAAAATQIFDRNGKPLYSFHGDTKRLLISDEEIPAYMRQATLAAEDRGFYHHFGVDYRGVLRAFYNNIFKKTSLQGGSTITQQYVKNALLDPRKTITRKIKELILSIEIELMYSKEQILTMYLNEIPYGSNAYGVEAAAQTFLGKHAKELSLAEAATLAALPQRPTYFSPYGSHPDRRLLRINWILDSMVDLGYVSKGDAEKAKTEAKNIKFAEPREFITSPHFVMYIKDQLVEKYGERMVEEGGLKVTTTLDLDKQIIAEDAVKAAASRRFDNINASNAALVSIDPKTGEVLSMVGSVNFFDEDIDGQVNVAEALRQPGSSFKPVAYAAAFKDKYNPAYPLWDVTTDFGNYIPKNYDGQTRGPVTMRQALAGSLNIPAVKTLALAGVDSVINTAHDMGITSLNDRDRYGLSLVLGGGEVRLIDLTTAYGVFANSGKLAPTISILKVENASGKVLEENKPGKDTKEVLDPQIAYQISSILSDNNARSYVFGSNSALYTSGRTTAAKTGTTSEYRDAWTMGYTPSLVVGVWVGNNDNSPMSAGAAGAMAAAPIWRQYITEALKDTPNEDFWQPPGINKITVDKLSNKLPTENSPETVTDVFASWQVPRDRDNIHLKVMIDKFTGKRATADCPAQFTEEKVITNVHSEKPNEPNWENPVLAAASQYGIIPYSLSDETSCTTTAPQTSVGITSPKNNSAVSQNFTIVAEGSYAASLKQVQFFIDNKSIGTVQSAPFTMEATGISPGKHTVAINAIDTFGTQHNAVISVIVLSE